MGDSEYDKALQREAEWLDEQLANHAAQTRAKRDAAVRADFARQPPVIADEPVKIEFVEQDFGVVAPPEPARVAQAVVGKPPFLSGLQAAFLFLLLVTAAFAVWQTMQSNTYKRIAERAALNVQKTSDAQMQLDDALCAANYPAVAKSINDKAAAKTKLTDSDKALQAFGAYRSETPNLTKGSLRVDADPSCGEMDDDPDPDAGTVSKAKAATDKAEKQP